MSETKKDVITNIKNLINKIKVFGEYCEEKNCNIFDEIKNIEGIEYFPNNLCEYIQVNFNKTESIGNYNSIDSALLKIFIPNQIQKANQEQNPGNITEGYLYEEKIYKILNIIKEKKVCPYFLTYYGSIKGCNIDFYNSLFKNDKQPFKQSYYHLTNIQNSEITPHESINNIENYSDEIENNIINNDLFYTLLFEKIYDKKDSILNYEYFELKNLKLENLKKVYFSMKFQLLISFYVLEKIKLLINLSNNSILLYKTEIKNIIYIIDNKVYTFNNYGIGIKIVNFNKSYIEILGENKSIGEDYDYKNNKDKDEVKDNIITYIENNPYIQFPYNKFVDGLNLKYFHNLIKSSEIFTTICDIINIEPENKNSFTDNIEHFAKKLEIKIQDRTNDSKYDYLVDDKKIDEILDEFRKQLSSSQPRASSSPRSTSPRSSSPPRSTSPRSTSPRSTSPRSTSPRSTSPRSTSPEKIVADTFYDEMINEFFLNRSKSKFSFKDNIKKYKKYRYTKNKKKLFEIIFDKRKNRVIISHIDNNYKDLDYLFTYIYNFLIKKSHKGSIIIYDNSKDFISPYFRYGFKYDIINSKNKDKNYPMFIENFSDYINKYGINYKKNKSIKFGTGLEDQKKNIKNMLSQIQDITLECTEGIEITKDAKDRMNSYKSYRNDLYNQYKDEIDKIDKNLKNSLDRLIRLNANQLASTLESINFQTGKIETKYNELKDDSNKFYFLDKLAETIVNIGANKSTLSPDLAFAFGNFANNITKKYPDFKKLFFYHLNEKCFYSIPLYKNKLSIENKDDYKKRIGYSTIEKQKLNKGVIETENYLEKTFNYIEKQNGYIRLFAAYIDKDDSKDDSKDNSIIDGLYWLKNIKDMKPIFITSSILYDFLLFCGNKIQKHYKDNNCSLISVQNFDSFLEDIINGNFFNKLPDSPEISKQRKLLLPFFIKNEKNEIKKHEDSKLVSSIEKQKIEPITDKDKITI